MEVHTPPFLEEKARARAKAAEPEAVRIARGAKTATWVANAIAFFALIVALVAVYSNWD
jgi:hypothetical protein